MDKSPSKFSLVQLVMLAAALTAAAIHLYLGLKFADVIFVLNGIGYIGLVGMYLLPINFLKPFHNLIGWALMGYSALTIILWAIMNGKPDPVGLLALGVEAAIIVTVLLDMRGRRKSTQLAGVEDRL